MEPSAPDDEAPGAEASPADHDRRRVGQALRLWRAVALLGLVGAVLSGIAGADGREGFALLLVLSAAGAAMAGLHLGVLLLADQFRGLPSGGRRGLWLVGMFLVTALLMASVAGVGG